MDLAFRLLKGDGKYIEHNEPAATPPMPQIDYKVHMPQMPQMPPMQMPQKPQRQPMNPQNLAAMRAARDAAREQMGQRNPDRGGDVDPI